MTDDVREALAELLFTLYDHGTQPNAFREADAILAEFNVTRKGALQKLIERLEAEREARTACEAFHWVGQSFKYCDECGRPFWEHTQTARGQGRFDPITPEEAAACREKWENT